MGDRWIAMLRSINVGGRGRLAMADLVATVEGLGFGEVSTYVQSGNVLFDGKGRPADSITAALEGELAGRGIDTTVVLRRPGELAAALDRHPFRGEVDPEARATALHVAFCVAAPVGDLTDADHQRVLPDRAAVDGSEVFLHYPGGMARSKLTGALLERRLGVRLTVRNWRTVSELVSRSS